MCFHITDSLRFYIKVICINFTGIYRVLFLCVSIYIYIFFFHEQIIIKFVFVALILEAVVGK